MTLSRNDQIKLAADLLPIIESSTDEKTLERLHSIAATILELSGFEDNGVAFDLSEYSYEAVQAAKGDEKVWSDRAKQSLIEAIKMAQ